MKILVTGCAGFIGANFTEYILDNYPLDTVIGVDCLTYAANLPALEGLCARRGFTFYREDICNRDAIDKVFASERPDVVVNFAAESHVDRSIDDSAIFVRTNVLGTEVLLASSLKYGVSRFHQISTDEVYGDLPVDSKREFTEHSPLRPSSPYSASKAAADLLVLSYKRTHGLSVSISRSANNYGKYQHVEKLIPKAVSFALQGMPFTIYGKGDNVRDWIHVSDHCRAVDLIIRHGKSGGVYNVGGNCQLSNLAIVDKIYASLGITPAPVCHVADRKGHDRKYALSSAKLMRELGFACEVDFDRGLAGTVEWYAENYK